MSTTLKQLQRIYLFLYIQKNIVRRLSGCLSVLVSTCTLLHTIRKALVVTASNRYGLCFTDWWPCWLVNNFPYRNYTEFSHLCLLIQVCLCSLDTAYILMFNLQRLVSIDSILVKSGNSFCWALMMQVTSSTNERQGVLLERNLMSKTGTVHFERQLCFVRDLKRLNMEGQKACMQTKRYFDFGLNLKYLNWLVLQQ